MAASPRLQSLLLRLSKYEIEVKYLQGKENVIADALSRVCPLLPMQEDYEPEIILIHIISNTVPATATKLVMFQDSTPNDSTLMKVKHTVHSGWPMHAKDCDPELKD